MTRRLRFGPGNQKPETGNGKADVNRPQDTGDGKLKREPRARRFRFRPARRFRPPRVVRAAAIDLSRVIPRRRGWCVPRRSVPVRISWSLFPAAC
jgi:hypothetical protein